MSRLIEDGRPVQDRFTALDDEAEITPGALLISLVRFRREAAAILARDLPFALRLPNTLDVRSLEADALNADTLVVDFPGFADGRAYSQAHQLREVLRYRGRIRASGAAVVRDQLQGMLRCGIDAFDLRADQDVQSCLDALREFSVAYQPGTGSDPLPQVRKVRLGASP